MADLHVMIAVENRLDLGFSGIDACPRVELNAGGAAPGDSTPFLVVEYPVSRSQQISVGAPGQNVWREEGAFRIVVAVPVGTRTRQALIWLDEIAKLYRGQVFDGVTCWAPSSPTPCDEDNNEDGSYFRMSIAVPYWADIIG